MENQGLYTLEENTLEESQDLHTVEEIIKEVETVHEEVRENLPIKDNTSHVHSKDSSFLKEKKGKKTKSVFLDTEEKKKDEVVFTKEGLETYVYFLSYEFEGETQSFFTSKTPEFEKEKIVFKDCFKKYTLQEEVLGKRRVSVSYKGSEKISMLKVSLKEGVIIKTVPEKSWMKLEQMQAERKFSDLVLAQYRELSKTTTPITKLSKEIEIEKF